MDEKNGRLEEQNGRAIWGRSPFMCPGHCSPQIFDGADRGAGSGTPHVKPAQVDPRGAALSGSLGLRDQLRLLFRFSQCEPSRAAASGLGANDRSGKLRRIVLGIASTCQSTKSRRDHGRTRSLDSLIPAQAGAFLWARPDREATSQSILRGEVIFLPVHSQVRLPGTSAGVRQSAVSAVCCGEQLPAGQSQYRGAEKDIP
ncbi:hypothetical protein N7510_002477 [Penicillium lagena]|uniref:uncharacterized protein n=1 Tax=Penicillium lagena TaxID=94218 RepID=UPI002540D238|nr:uncharacterized protein N7510_002477 [Penicillium lagena]KAJ5626168.1 hypothetical protein N7510_002477 [Penicillium lagena]